MKSSADGSIRGMRDEFRGGCRGMGLSAEGTGAQASMALKTAAEIERIGETTLFGHFGDGQRGEAQQVNRILQPYFVAEFHDRTPGMPLEGALKMTKAASCRSRQFFHRNGVMETLP